MQASRLEAIFTQARATAGDADLPAHVQSLATTIERMASKIAGDPAPTRFDIFTLEQAVCILERWLTDQRGSDAQPSGSTVALDDALLADALELPGL